MTLSSLVVGAAPAIEPAARWQRGAFVALLGVALSNWDKALFPFLAPFIASTFFGGGDPFLNVVKTCGILWGSQLLRPLGGWWLGRLADQKGCRYALVASLLGMGLSTLLIACTPAYEQIGLLSPLLFFIGRCSVNFFGGGESAVGGVAAIDQAPADRRTIVSGAVELMVMVGISLAGCEVALLASYGLIDWWRLAVVLMTVLAGVTFCLRIAALKERSPAAACKPRKQLLKSTRSFLWREEAPLFWSLVLLAGFTKINYSLSISFMNGFLPLTSLLTREQVTAMTAALLWLDTLSLPLFGWLARAVGARRQMVIAATASLVLSIPLFELLCSSSHHAVVIARIAFIAIGVAFSAPLRHWAGEVVPSATRCELISTAFSLSRTLFSGGTTLLLLIYGAGGSPLLMGFLPAGMGAAALIAFAVIERYQQRQPSLAVR